MVGARRVAAAPVAAEHRQVDVPAARRLLAVGDDLHRLRAHRQRRHSWRRRQALLRAAVADVDAPVVDPQLAAAERGDGVGEQQRAVLVGEARNLSSGWSAPVLRLAVDDRDDLDVGPRP